MNTTWKVVLAFIAVFIAGVVFGGGFALRISRQAARREEPRGPILSPMAQRAANPRAPLGTQLLRRFVEGLDLTEEQREKLRPLVQHAEEQIIAVRQRSLDETEQILRELQQAFRAELKPEQIRKLNRMQQKQMENIRQERMRQQQQPQPGMPPNQPFTQQRPNRKNPGQPGQQGPAGPVNPPPRDFGPGQPQPQNQGAPEYSPPPGPPPGGQNPPPPEGANPLPRNP